jgi:hypothetical protein
MSGCKNPRRRKLCYLALQDFPFFHSLCSLLLKLDPTPAKFAIIHNDGRISAHYIARHLRSNDIVNLSSNALIKLRDTQDSSATMSVVTSGAP